MGGQAAGQGLTVPIHRTLAAIVLACGAPLAAAGQAASTARHDTTGVLLVGRNETARVVINIIESPSTGDQPWHGPGTPIVPGHHASVGFWTDLPVTLGQASLPAGRFRLWPVLEEGTPVLIVSRPPPTDGTFDPDTEVARTSLEMERRDGVTQGFAASILTARTGPDTVGFVDRSTPERRITGMEIRPATHSTLEFLVGHWRLTVPIAAR